jgi:hypothetical protein
MAWRHTISPACVIPQATRSDRTDTQDQKISKSHPTEGGCPDYEMNGCGVPAGPNPHAKWEYVDSDGLLQPPQQKHSHLILGVQTKDALRLLPLPGATSLGKAPAGLVDELKSNKQRDASIVDYPSKTMLQALIWALNAKLNAQR